MTKAKPVAREKPAETSIMANTVPGSSQAVDIADQADAVAYAEPGPDRESELAALVKAMQARLDQLEGRTNESYADDDKLFIAKPSGEQWSERRLDKASKSYVDVQMQATAFYGPFATPEAVAAYVDAKKGKRAGDYMEWEGIRTVTGREKRKIEAQERADREDQGLVPKIPQYFSGR